MPRVLVVLLFVLPMVGCATTLKLAPDSSIPSVIVSEWAPAKVVQQRITIKVEAPEVAFGRKYWEDQPSLKRISALEYPARQMLTEAAEISAKRWFSEVEIGSSARDLLFIVSIRDLIYNKGTDILVWRPIIEANITVSAKDAKRTIYHGEFTSGRLSGDFVKDFNGQTFVTQEHYVQYTRLIYHALLIALDKAMADLAQRKPAPNAPP